MRAALVLASGAVVALVLGAVPVPAEAPDRALHVCDPYPLGYCGTYEGQRVTWCYYWVNGRMVDATEVDVVTLGTTTPGLVSLHGGGPGMLYLHRGPATAFVADPYEAPVPVRSLFLEGNAWEGLQARPSYCSEFVWYAECCEPDQWLYFAAVRLAPDTLLV